MSVLLRDMEMPKTCAYCRFIYADPNIEYEQPDGTKMVGGCCCCFTGNVIWNTKRDDDCPLGDVPTPHGKLVDASVAYDKIAEAAGEGSGNYVDMDVVDRGLSETPTIIEAEE